VDLVAILKLHGRSIWPFVYVLSNVLQGSKGDRCLNVDVTVVLGREVRVIWDDPGVVNVVVANSVLPAVIWCAVLRIALSIHASFFAKWTREALGAFPILHAWSIRIQLAARAVNHTALNSGEEQRLSVRIWPVSANAAVNVLGSADLVVRVEKDQEMHVGTSAKTV
jgi:hypothetical protein